MENGTTVTANDLMAAILDVGNTMEEGFARNARSGGGNDFNIRDRFTEWRRQIEQQRANRPAS
jgi:hypothetical protein